MLDPTDLSILRALEFDARKSFNSLAGEIGLSKTPTWTRVRELERREIINGYRAQIDPARLGLELHAFVQITIDASRHDDFEAAIVHHRSVLECYTTAGQGDYLLHVLVTGITALDAMLRGDLALMPGVQRLVTTVGMKTIKQQGSIMDCLGREQE